MIRLYDDETGVLIGELTEEQLDFLMEEMEEESRRDDNYFLDQDTLDLLADAGADDELLALLQRALDEREGTVELRWSRA